MLVNVYDLTPAALNWVVAVIINSESKINYGPVVFNKETKRVYLTEGLMYNGIPFDCIKNYQIAVELMDKEQIEVTYTGQQTIAKRWCKEEQNWISGVVTGNSLRKAVMICFVKSRLGNMCDVPPELQE